MSETKHLILAIVLGCAVLGAGGAALVWPQWHEASSTFARTVELKRKVADLTERTHEVRVVAGELESAKAQMVRELKLIPDSPNVANVMQELSLPVDGLVVLDQTFTAGSPTEAAIGYDFPERATPLTVEMTSTFESAFAVLRTAEEMERMVRVSSLRLLTDRSARQDADVPLVSASVGLEIIYDPMDGGEER